ncbi:hypothetical protein [Rhizobium leguminosarum]
MLEMIIKNSLEVVDRTERLIDAARRLPGVGLDEVEAYRLHAEIEKLTDVVLAMDEAAPASATNLRASARNRPLLGRKFDGPLTDNSHQELSRMTSAIPMRWELRQDRP